MKAFAAANLIKEGDWLIIVAAGTLVVWLAFAPWRQGGAERVVIRSGGQVFADLGLQRDRSISVPGPLGISHIRIENRRVRVASDPSPRQYCVQQGWLARPGESAICLPNQVSVELTGRVKLYDSLNY